MRRAIAKLLRPDLFVVRIFDIPLEELGRRNIAGLLLDLDNTLTEWGQEHINEEIVNWIMEAQSGGFKICLVSNNHGERLARISDQLGIPYIERATKPRKKAFRRALEIMELQPAQAAVIGDQVFTDVLGGNRLGLYTILVNPMSRREFIGTRLVRIPERAVLGFIKPKGNKGVE